MVAEAPTSPAHELTVPDALPVLPLRGGMVVLPPAVMPLMVGQPRSVQLIDDIVRNDRLLVPVAQRTEPTEQPGTDDLYRVGTAAIVHQLARLPDGGITEKVLAAHRAGIRTVILPKRNERDLEELAPELRQEMEFAPVESAEEVLARALESSPTATDGRLSLPPGGRRSGETRTVGGEALSIFDIIWIFFLLSSLQPVLQKWYLTTQRARAFQNLEKRRESRVIGLIHRHETMAFLGFPVARYIDIEDSEAVLRAIQLTDKTVPIDMILHTPGGLVLAASQIASALRAHEAKVTVFVPHYAMSGGTLISLAADEIVMAPHAVLGPVDPQLGQHPAASLIKVVEQKPIAEIDDQTLIEADQARKSLTQVEGFVRNLLEERMGEKAAPLAHLLASGTWTHDYPIQINEARQMGLTVSTDMPNEVYELMGLYPQTAQRRPSVEYVPLPYRGRQREQQARASRGVVDV